MLLRGLRATEETIMTTPNQRTRLRVNQNGLYTESWLTTDEDGSCFEVDQMPWPLPGQQHSGVPPSPRHW